MKTPWHLWIIGVVTLIWNGFGAVDYVMTQLRYEPYMAQFTDAQRTYFESFPTWVQGTWALAVWLSVAGSLALLVRSKWASTLFGVVLVCMAATFAHNFILAEVTMSAIMGPLAKWFTLAIIVVALLLWLYARKLRQAGVLR